MRSLQLRYSATGLKLQRITADNGSFAQIPTLITQSFDMR
jgi:hypothetical protein